MRFSFDEVHGLARGPVLEHVTIEKQWRWWRLTLWGRKCSLHLFATRKKVFQPQIQRMVQRRYG